MCGSWIAETMWPLTLWRLCHLPLLTYGLSLLSVLCSRQLAGRKSNRYTWITIRRDISVHHMGFYFYHLVMIIPFISLMAARQHRTMSTLKWKIWVVVVWEIFDEGGTACWWRAWTVCTWWLFSYDRQWLAITRRMGVSLGVVWGDRGRVDSAVCGGGGDWRWF